MPTPCYQMVWSKATPTLSQVSNTWVNIFIHCITFILKFLKLKWSSSVILSPNSQKDLVYSIVFNVKKFYICTNCNLYHIQKGTFGNFSFGPVSNWCTDEKPRRNSATGAFVEPLGQEGVERRLEWRVRRIKKNKKNKTTKLTKKQKLFLNKQLNLVL